MFLGVLGQGRPVVPLALLVLLLMGSPDVQTQLSNAAGAVKFQASCDIWNENSVCHSRHEAVAPHPGWKMCPRRT